MKKNDCILFGGILFVAIVIFLIYSFFPAAPGKSVIIQVDGKVEQTLPLSKDTMFTIQNGKYKNILQIKDGFASIVEANCPDKLCVHQHHISKQGETLICLPHKLVIIVENGSSEDEFDEIVK